MCYDGSVLKKLDGGDKIGITVGGTFMGHGLCHYHIRSCIAICL